MYKRGTTQGQLSHIDTSVVTKLINTINSTTISPWFFLFHPLEGQIIWKPKSFQVCSITKSVFSGLKNNRTTLKFFYWSDLTIYERYHLISWYCIGFYEATNEMGSWIIHEYERFQINWPTGNWGRAYFIVSFLRCSSIYVTLSTTFSQ